MAWRKGAVADGWIIALADACPRIREFHHCDDCEGFRDGPGARSPAYKGQRGHPVGLGKRFGAQLAALGGDAGARESSLQQKRAAAEIQCNDPGVLHDIDRREDQRATVDKVPAKVLLAAGALACAGVCTAQNYPSRYIRMIVPYVPGGGTDTLTRTIAPKLGETLGQQIIIEIASAAAAPSAPRSLLRRCPTAIHC